MAKISEGELIPSTVDEYRSQLQEQWADILGSDYLLDDQTPQGQLIGILADAFATTDEVAVSLWNASRLETAQGAQLDWYGALLNIYRLPGRFTRARVVFTGTPGVEIPAGTRVRTQSGVMFATTETLEIQGGGVTRRTFVRTLNRGSWVAAAREINIIVDTASGVQSVINSDAAISGLPPESDADYRRRLSRAKRSAPGYIDSIRQRLLAVDGVTEASVYANEGTAPLPLQGVNIVAGTILCAVLGGSDSDVAAAIFNAKPLGVPTSGSESANVTQAVWTQAVNFERITEVQIRINIAVRANLDLYPPNGNEQIQSAIFAFLTGPSTPLQTGRSVDLNALYGYVYAVPGASLASDPTVTDTNDDALPGVTPLFTVYRIELENIRITRA